MILCCGEALIDMIPCDSRSGDLAFTPKTGGSVFNTAMGLGRLGADVGLFTGISQDRLGTLLRQDLMQSNVSLTHVKHSTRPTTLAFVHLDDGQASYSFFDEQSAGRMLAISDLPEDLGSVSTLFFGGISLVSEPGADSLLALAKREAAEKLIMVDPNIRADFIDDEPAYRARLTEIVSVADIVKISDQDLNWVSEGNEPIEEKAQKLLDLGPSLVLLTLGDKGAIAFSKSLGQIHVPSESVDVVDTVGAGDSFNAGFLQALWALGYASKSGFQTLDRDALHSCMAQATRVAGFTVGQQGAAMPWKDQIEALLPA